MADTKAHNNKVLAVRLAKTSAFEGAGGVGISAMNGGIQDGLRIRGNSFHQMARNLFERGLFHGKTRPRHGLLFKNQNQS
jgi:hypothetical protein